MVKRYYGGVISATQAVVNVGSASGLFNASQQMQAKQAGNWPLPYFGPPTIEYLVVAGGGAGGSGVINYSIGSGGGAGGLLTATGYAVSSGIPISVTIGAGGTPIISTAGTNGSNSTFGTITAIGGGHGDANGGGSGQDAGNGGSGGGAFTTAGVGVYPGSTYLSQARQGYNGGINASAGAYPYPSGGGGGAGAQGGNGTGSTGGAGGVGLSSSINGTATYYAGGGGGTIVVSGTPGSGGSGGGGSGAIASTPGASGTVNTGGGGGGSGGTTSARSLGGSGGSGIVIIRYADTYAAALSTTGATYTTPTGYRVYTWTSSGSITF